LKLSWVVFHRNYAKEIKKEMARKLQDKKLPATNTAGNVAG